MTMKRITEVRAEAVASVMEGMGVKAFYLSIGGVEYKPGKWLIPTPLIDVSGGGDFQTLYVNPADSSVKNWKTTTARQAFDLDGEMTKAIEEEEEKARKAAGREVSKEKKKASDEKRRDAKSKNTSPPQVLI